MFLETEVSKRIWDHLAAVTHIIDIFRLQTRDWILMNLKSNLIVNNGLECHVVLGVTCWFLWYWRNKTLFDDNFERSEIDVMAILKYTSYVQKAYDGAGEILSKGWSNIKWQPPEVGWVKINIDGAAKSQMGRAGCGGIIRNERRMDGWFHQ